MMTREIEHTEIGGLRFTIIPIVNFEEWLSKRYGSYDKFNQLNRRDKEKIFLRWKWGSEDELSNENAEISERASLFQFKDADLNSMSEGIKFYIQNKIDFDRICYTTKERLGLIIKHNPLVDKIANTFSAQGY